MIPKIKCLSGFQCAYCTDCKKYKYPLCPKHEHKWNLLNIITRNDLIVRIDKFNTGKGYENRRTLQIFINKIEIFDELNKKFHNQDECR